MLRFLTLVTQRWQSAAGCSLTAQRGRKLLPAAASTFLHRTSVPPKHPLQQLQQRATRLQLTFVSCDIILQCSITNLTKLYHLFGEKIQSANKSIIHGISHVKHLEKFSRVKDVTKMSEGWFRSVIGEICVFLFPAVNSSD